MGQPNPNHYELSADGTYYEMKEPYSTRYAEGLATQIRLWVEGKSTHTPDLVDEDGVKIRGYECCPDFSCCCPNLLWDKGTRLKFQTADANTRSFMLTMSLSAMAADLGVTVRHAGDPTTLN